MIFLIQKVSYYLDYIYIIIYNSCMETIKDKIIKIIIFLLIILFAYEIRVQAVTIVLDPGHGGTDPGSLNSTYGIKESNINYKIATYLKEYLEVYKNVKVILTRRENEYKTLQERADVGFRSNADLLLSLHINSSDNESATGCERICYL